MGKRDRMTGAPSERDPGSGKRDLRDRADNALDRLLSRLVGRARRSQERYKESIPKIKSTVDKVAKESAVTLRTLDKKGDEFVDRIKISKLTDLFITPVTKYPFLPLILVLAMVFASIPGILNIRDNIRGDMEVYLPLDAEETEIIEEVREDWTIDILMIYVETDNVHDRTNETNITDLRVLNEISDVEATLNHRRDDNGENDDVLFVLSVSTLIKELNSTPPRFANAFKDEFLGGGLIGSAELPPGEYDIPQDQERIDGYLEQIPPGTIAPLLADTNDDGTYDSTIVIMGLSKEADQERFLGRVERKISKVKYCNMTSTGPIPMTHALSERTYSEMVRVVPVAVIMIALSLFLFHRNWKILIIEGVPLVSELLITFGVVGALGITLTPQIVLVAPIIASLGVANGLYITNKYSEEEHIEDKALRMRAAIQSTGRPILFAALTTSFGFASLMAIDMIPLKMLGFALAFGIFVDYIITFLSVPALILLLRYKKRTKFHKTSRLAKMPVDHTRKILFVSIILVLGSAVAIFYPGIEANMDYIAMSPQDEPVIIKMNEYTENFDGGQINMFLVRGRESRETTVKNSLKDIEMLDDLDYLTRQINGDPENEEVGGVENSLAIGITEIMKSVKIPNMTSVEPVKDIFEMFPEVEEAYYNNVDGNYTFWDLIHSNNLDSHRKLQIINVFYKTLSDEMRGMLVNDDYSRTLVYVSMPNMDTVNTENAVNGVNDRLSKYPVGDSTSKLTGFGPIVVTVNNLLVWSSLKSTLLAIALVGILLVIGFRSLKYAIFTIIPVICIVAFQPITFLLTKSIGGLISALPLVPPQHFSADLNLFTAMLGSIIIGLGIDFAIHMTDTVREKGLSHRSVSDSVATTGRSFVETTITMSMGLAAIFWVNIVSVREFMVLIILLLLFSMLAGLIILPALYSYYIRSRTEIKAKDERRKRAA